MSNNLGNLLVGFGLDLTALQKDAPEAFRILNQSTDGMSAEMKRASREGAESLRLISENLGLHVSRPLSRILTQEFPAFATGLQTILGGAVAGAVIDIGIRGFEKISQSIEKAQKAQEAFAESTRKARDTFEDIMASFEKSEKLRSLTGLDKKLFEIDSSAAEESRRKIDQLTKALEENAKAAAAAGGWWTKFKAAIGDAASQIFSSPNALNAEKLDAQLGEFKEKLDALGRIDGLNQTHYAAAAISAELDAANQKLLKLQADGTTIIKPRLTPGGQLVEGVSQSAASSEEIAAQQRYIEALKELRSVQSGGDVAQRAGENDARMEAAKKAIHDAQEEMKGWNQENNKAVEAWVKLNAELDKALKKVDENIFKETSGRMKEATLGRQVAPPPGAPMLKDQEELMKISGQWQGENPIDQQTESWKKAGQVLEQIETPAQKYAIALQTLKTLEDQGRLSADQVALAMQKLGEEMTKAQLHVQRMQEELVHLLEKSTSASAGMKAFFLQLQIDSSETGKFAFSILNQGLKGFEDEVTKAVFTGKAHWRDYFRSLSEEAFKFLLNKEIAGFFQMMGNTGVGKSLGLDKLLPDTKSLAETANTTALATNTAALAANTAALSAAAGASLGGGAGAGAPSLFIPGFASGTDSAPGGLAWVGEQGPELLNLPGGTSITPSSAVRNGSGDQHFYIDAKGAEIGVEEKIVRALRAAEPRMIGKALANFTEVQRRTPQR